MKKTRTRKPRAAGVRLPITYEDFCVEVVYTRKAGLMLRRARLEDLLAKAQAADKRPLFVIGFERSPGDVLQVTCEVQRK